MSCGNAIMVEDFAVGSQSGGEIVAIPGSEARRAIVRIILGIIGAAADCVRCPNTVTAAAFGYRIAIGHDARAWRHAVARVYAIGAVCEECTKHSAGADRRNTSR